MEIVLAVTILGVAMAIVFQALSMGQRSWARGTEAVTEATRLRVVLDLMTSQLRSAQRYEEVSAGAAVKVLKEWTTGDSSSVGFVTAMPYGAGRKEGLYYVRYFLSGDEGSDKTALKMLQAPVYAGHPDGYGEAEEEGATVLLPDVGEAAFEFAGADAEDKGFDGQWPPGAGGKEALRFVRFAFEYPEGGGMSGKKATFAVFSDVEERKGNP